LLLHLQIRMGNLHLREIRPILYPSSP
jgi:hypothetical protein